MASELVKRETDKIAESCRKLENMSTEADIRNELSKIKEYCSMIESQL